MNLLQNVSLKPYNTFGMDVTAEFFTTVTDVTQLPEISHESLDSLKKWIIGGGSNILLTKPVNGLVIKNEIKGISIVEENRDHVWIEVGAGVVWHDLVLHTINKGWGGLENLSLIPGCVGASPIQNIGAYGVEIKDVLDEVTAWRWDEKKFMVLKNEHCKFKYRDSVFKSGKHKDVSIITSVTYKLNKKPKLNTEYGAIQQQLEKMGVENPSIKSISDAVIAIRSSKLPNPKLLGNAGSFFKNPVISQEQYAILKTNYPTIAAYNTNAEQVKIAAGWLIEHAGWKGFKKGLVGIHDQQALVLVNYDDANGKAIYDLSTEIILSIKEKFNIELEREVQIW